MNRGPSIWIVDDEHWPRACLRAELLERGYDAVGFETTRDVLVQMVLDSMRPALLVVTVSAQPLSGRQVNALKKEGIPIWAVGGAATSPDHPLLAASAKVLRRPLTIGEIADEIQRAVPVGPKCPKPGAAR
jgi:FixJ family two-component response regulator